MGGTTMSNEDNKITVPEDVLADEQHESNDYKSMNESSKDKGGTFAHISYYLGIMVLVISVLRYAMVLNEQTIDSLSLLTFGSGVFTGIILIGLGKIVGILEQINSKL